MAQALSPANPFFHSFSHSRPRFGKKRTPIPNRERKATGDLVWELEIRLDGRAFVLVLADHTRQPIA